MPEPYKLMPILGNVQKAGYKVALSYRWAFICASGKIPAAIHVTPEAAKGGRIENRRSHFADAPKAGLKAISANAPPHVAQPTPWRNSSPGLR